jgi:predicted anti-sigma-YlaC factor YlaD
LNCADFREEYQSSLDGRPGGELPHVLQEHLDLCPGCTSYVSEMGGLDQALRAMPEVEIPPQLFASLNQVPASLHEGVAGYVVRYTALVLVAVVGWIFAGIASPEVELLINGLILAAGAFTFARGLLAPLYLNPIPDA